MEICLLQEPKTVAALWKSKMFSSPIVIYVVALKTLFGMKDKAREAYAADNSGPHRKPHPKSQVAPYNRVDYLTHDSLLRGLIGPGLLPTFQRFRGIFKKQTMMCLDRQDQSTQWVPMPDMLQFYKDHIGRAILESIFGPLLLSVNPTFMKTLWEFDEASPVLARSIPRWLVPHAYRCRDSLIEQIQNWYKYARAQFHDSLITEDGNDDPCWGSEMMRERQQFLLAVDGQDDASLASTDLGLIWVSVTNLVPSAMMTLLHIFADPVLLRRVRESMRDEVIVTNKGAVGEVAEVEIYMEKVIKNPLLQAVYAETLRLYVQAFVTRSSAHEPVAVNQWWLNQEDVVMVNSYPNHMNKKIWNEGPNGAYPVDIFWADRFLRDPQDPQSGPMGDRGYQDEKVEMMSEGTKPFFTLSGLEGQWIPFGGGSSACPGRIFAKRVILYTCAYFVSQFDISVPSSTWEMDSSAFGLGTQKPKRKIPFAIRRRILPLEEM
ncbi:cytochrome P450 [Penicillium taxi]|uniref:cytochrome P450 n=1 Tax=Penicillium taxi TaxID=168475 RepID=UPI00254597DC|nr:cytochrome P450 [Penicillium taxi]KAJ5885522.1 cytochrome P450 [Penicillium taxi]